MSVALTSRPGEVPTPPWDMPRYAAAVYRSLGPLTYPDPENGWTLAALVDAWTTIEGWIGEASRPEPGTGESPWSAVLDPWRCPWWALRWCGQAYGLRLQPELGAWVHPTADVEARWRQSIADRLGWHRGHPESIIALARQHMQGLQRLQLRERYNPALGAETDAPWHLQLRVRSSDVIPGHADALIAAVRAAIPVGIVADIVVTNDRDWDEVVATWSSWSAAVAANTSWEDLISAD